MQNQNKSVYCSMVKPPTIESIINSCSHIGVIHMHLRIVNQCMYIVGRHMIESFRNYISDW